MSVLHVWKNIWMKNGLIWSLTENKQVTPSKMIMWCMWSLWEYNESTWIFFLKNKKLTLNTDKPWTFWKQLPFMKKSGGRNAWVVSCRSHQAGTLILVNGIFPWFLLHLSVNLINISVYDQCVCGCGWMLRLL